MKELTVLQKVHKSIHVWNSASIIKQEKLVLKQFIFFYASISSINTTILPGKTEAKTIELKCVVLFLLFFGKTLKAY